MVKRAIGAVEEIIPPKRHVPLGDRLRREFHHVIATREHALKLCDTLADLLGAVQISGLLVALSGSLDRQQALLLDEAIEVGIRNGPGIALVLDELMYDGNRAARSAFVQFNWAKQPRGMGKLHRFGQETADLDFGIDAGLDAAKQLQDVLVAQDNGRIRLLGIDSADVLGS